VILKKLEWDLGELAHESLGPGEILAMGESEALTLRDSESESVTGKDNLMQQKSSRRFTARSKPQDWKILTNDWPLSIPSGI
jgi:hypothetical protein